MGYLVTMVAFSGWMIIQSSLWVFGFYSQGPVTPTNLGPKGAVAAWVVLQASPGTLSQKFSAYAAYPQAPWAEPDPNNKEQTADIQTVDSAAAHLPGVAAQHGAEPEHRRPPGVLHHGLHGG